jgi:molybdopterin synthase catalytic subunit
MKVLGIVGSGAQELATRVGPELDGRVVTVTAREGTDRDPATDADAAYELGEDGRWTGSGTGQSLDDVLDDAAPDYDFALVIDFPNARVPTVALGAVDAAGETVLRADDADAVAVDDVLDAAEEIEPHVTLETLVERVKASPRAERAGAIATFTGRVRAKDAPDDSPTHYLEFEKYEGVAEDRMRAISDELEEREGVLDVVMHHRTGRIEYGEDIVFVVVLAGHREEAFRTVEDGINRLKDEVPIFKKETTDDEEFWVHDRS